MRQSSRYRDYILVEGSRHSEVALNHLTIRWASLLVPCTEVVPSWSLIDQRVVAIAIVTIWSQAEKARCFSVAESVFPLSHIFATAVMKQIAQLWES